MPKELTVKKDEINLRIILMSAHNSIKCLHFCFSRTAKHCLKFLLYGDCIC